MHCVRNLPVLSTELAYLCSKLNELLEWLKLGLLFGFAGSMKLLQFEWLVSLWSWILIACESLFTLNFFANLFELVLDLFPSNVEFRLPVLKSFEFCREY